MDPLGSSMLVFVGVPQVHDAASFAFLIAAGGAYCFNIAAER